MIRRHALKVILSGGLATSVCQFIPSFATACWDTADDEMIVPGPQILDTDKLSAIISRYIDDNSEGVFQWTTKSAPEATNSHMHTLRGGVENFLQVRKDSQLTSWEAVFWLCFNCLDRAQQQMFATVVPRWIKGGTEYRENILDELLGYRRSMRLDVQLEIGDIIFFYADSHVALSLGNDEALSLWSGPNGRTSLQRTSVQELFSFTESNPEIYLSALLRLFESLGGGADLIADLEELGKNLEADSSMRPDEVFNRVDHLLQKHDATKALTDYEITYCRFRSIQPERIDY